MTRRNDPQVLYLHVPFCRSICYYCDFCHTVFAREKADAWLDALAEELKRREINSHLVTAYIGGGTPTALEISQLDRLLTMLDPYTQEVTEYTCEVNPESLDEEKAACMARHGISRASIGWQTSDPQLLRSTGRHHTAEDAEKAADILRKQGITNLSFDLMYSLPGQTMESLRKSVWDVLRLRPEHLSLYSLTVEENTVFGKKGVSPLDEDTEADMYEWICAELERAGYVHYEISNFARPGFESKHNTAYWEYRDFYGVSCGASGKEPGLRYDNTRSLAQYLRDPLTRTEIPLTRREEMFEAVMMGLRLKRGMSVSLFEERFACTVQQAYGKKLQALLEKGMLESGGDTLRCTDKGYPLLNDILVELMDEEGE